MANYRIQHRETGLFFIPVRSIFVNVEDTNLAYGRIPFGLDARGRIRVKSNLSKQGRIYWQYPKLTWCKQYRNHLQLVIRNGYPKSVIVDCTDDLEAHWKIVEVPDG